VWACDYSDSTGEGKLAQLFIKKFNLKKKFRVIINKKQNFNKYLSPIIGIFFCWIKSAKKQNTCYLNYLPFWNFLIFMLLPNQTILGPITGGANFAKKKNINYFIRSKLFPIFYNISEFFLKKRNVRKIFSTDLLKKYLSKDLINQAKFNFIFSAYKKRKVIKKDIEFLVYYRKHNNKINLFQYDTIRKLLSFNIKVKIVGDRLNLKGVKNMGFQTNKMISKLQARSMYTINSEESVYTFFTIECLSNNMKVLIDPKYKRIVKFKKKKFIFINFKKITNLSSYKKIIKT
jgi:hypothetical protein